MRVAASRQAMRETSIRAALLSREDADSIRQWSGAFGGDPYAPDTRDYLRTIAEHLSDLPARLLGAVHDFADVAGGAGVLLLRGLPIPERLPRIPVVPARQARIAIGTEPIVLGVGLLVGEPISLAYLRGGDRVHNIYPVPDDAETQKASSSVRRLEMHTEMAFQQQAPQALALLCLRAGDTPPATGFCDLHSVWKQLDAVQQSRLMEPAFGFPGADPDGAIAQPQPIAVPAAGGLHLRYDSGARGNTSAHEAALAALRAKAEAMAVEVTLAAGDLVLIDNTRVVHSRSPFRPSYAGGDRWLQRCLIARRQRS